ncbi:hypothetical protein PPL_02648 [Heterostelium album PN500]|uniref:Prokaryotic-type class I peptide chain release factors domain-containing protein n=1 Tax=Heterostelium pallidum (strain ATCC 26659 / Pp 5 / PN500) TaxID=670386 RepID=D3B2N4_HETP5|nr:hypothetical protein PPL_02648 [Heterostelium album PN500]EFA83582.1 hypothetical protein PPL_02648 [Heterostelium album PN500]|eukprot:XP_020435699.1 hypothetical protein PPL_02648 [Heterostelium album PN500]
MITIVNKTNRLNQYSISSLFVANYSSVTFYLYFSTTLQKQRSNVKIHVPREKIDFQFSRSSGAGGQNVNKVNTKVEARFNLDNADWLSEHCRDTLRMQYAKNITSDGEFVINSSKHREQKLNVSDVIEKLEKIVTKASIIPKERLPTDVPTYAEEKRKKDKMNLMEFNCLISTLNLFNLEMKSANSNYNYYNGNSVFNDQQQQQPIIYNFSNEPQQQLFQFNFQQPQQQQQQDFFQLPEQSNEFLISNEYASAVSTGSYLYDFQQNNELDRMLVDNNSLQQQQQPLKSISTNTNNINSFQDTISTIPIYNIDTNCSSADQMIVIPTDINFYVYKVLSWLINYDSNYIINYYNLQSMELIKYSLECAKNVLVAHETPMSFFPLVLYYADKFVNRCGINHKQIFNLLLISSVMCVKFWGETVRVDYQVLGKFFNFTGKDFCYMEKLFLNGINFELYVHNNLIKEFLEQLEKEKESFESKCDFFHCEHITDIKESLDSNKILKFSDDQEDESVSSVYSNRIEELWETIKLSTDRYRSLFEKEETISDHFRKLHEYLTLEEYKLKKPIVEDKDRIKQHFDTSLDLLRKLIGIINLNSNNISKISESSEGSNSYGDSIEPDTQDRYSFKSALESVEKSKSLLEFVEDNKKTLFYFHNEILTKMMEHYDNDYNVMLLDLLYKFNRKFSLMTKPDIMSNLLKSVKNYRLTVSDFDFDKLNEIIQLSIQLDLDCRHQAYIFSLHYSRLKSDGMLIGTDNNSVEQLSMKHLPNTFNSVVSVGEFIYVFGGNDSERTCHRLSVKTRELITEEMTGIKGGTYISVCYDGEDHIYLVCGFENDKHIDRVDRYNIRTNKFETHGEIPLFSYLLVSFVYNGKLYSIQQYSRELVIYDIATKKSETHSSTHLFSHSMSACTDGNGNVYIHSSEKQFIRFNVTTKQSVTLKSTDIESHGATLSMLYHHNNNNKNNCNTDNNNNNDYIYLMGGVIFKNHRYSLKYDNWETFYNEDNRIRGGYGSALLYPNQICRVLDAIFCIHKRINHILATVSISSVLKNH